MHASVVSCLSRRLPWASDVARLWASISANDRYRQLVSEGLNPTAAIHKYNPRANSWDHISDMPSARYDCLVAVLPTNEMMAVGGKTPFVVDKVEIASISMLE